VYIKCPKEYECIIGAYEMENYIVLYKGEYYDISSGAKMNLFTTDELIEWGVDVDCRLLD
jgi:hypothetical protein